VDSPTPQDLSQYIQTLKQLKELTTDSNPWIPLWSAIAGGLIASIPNGIGAFLRGRSTRKSVTSALLIEIENITSVIKKRSFLHQLIETRDELIEINNQIAKNHNNSETHPPFENVTFTVAVSEDKFKIYKANLDKIGLIDRKTALKIVKFYSLIESIILDIKPEGALGMIGSVEAYTEVIMFLEDALKLADELSIQKT